MDSIIGKTIAIISYAEIRYVGTIDNFDGDKKIITVSNVRIFGTEDRVVDSSKVERRCRQDVEHIGREARRREACITAGNGGVYPDAE
ncbi:hypothetical protein JL09_g6123 [Pichia kudriavzevii]|uniref:Lsm14-like N-terminal domain-containing protein n=1 Tax=Pichia kudriavzevii TaxID=4909 RepID=A0A099NPI8_PICKU|nr:hypothetical protein JL09_g6123 [Pichia kudriavzevii]